MSIDVKALSWNGPPEPWVHIYRAPRTSKAAEIRALEMLSRLELAFLSRPVCSMCDKPLDIAGCGAFLFSPCPEETRIHRIKKALDTYAPRKARGTA